MAVTEFAHISDPHLPLQPGLPRPLTLLAGKRLLGYLSWRLGRDRRHTPAALRAVCEDIAGHGPGHLLVTGDLVNIALPEEFAAARAWLESLGAPGDVSVAPGNHDATVAMPWRSGLGVWEPWLTGDGGPDPNSDDPEGRFPVVRRRGDVAFVMLSSAVSTPPLIAAGRLGRTQIARTEGVLGELGRAGLFRVVAVHHPPLPGVVAARKGLRDCSEFQAMLASAGAELVVHGHCHRSHFAYLPGPDGPVPVVGVPSASAVPGSRDRHARWHLFRVSRTGDGWNLSLTVRGLRHDGRCAKEGGWTMLLSAGQSGAGKAPSPMQPD